MTPADARESLGFIECISFATMNLIDSAGDETSAFRDYGTGLAERR